MKKEVKIAEWTGVLVYLEHQNGRLNSISLELIGEAVRLGKASNQAVYVVAVGEGLEGLKEELQGFPVLAAHFYELSGGFRVDAYEKAVARCIAVLKPSIMLLGGTNEGRSLAPRLAVEFRTGLTADCTDLAIDESGNLLQTRPAFGGNVMASIVTKETRPQLVTLREKVKTPVLPSFQNEIAFFFHSAKDCISQIQLLTSKMLEEPESISNASLLLVAGRGISKKEDLAKLRELAHLLGGQLACSRALVEKGWLTPREQIGLSGNTVNPKWMITFGVSGTVQFMAGMKQTKNIIAINNDPNARIFDIAHYPILADLHLVVEELLIMAKERNG